MASSISSPRIVLVSLQSNSFFREIYSEFLTKLESRSNIHEITDPNLVVSLFEEQGNYRGPDAVLITDAALVEVKYARIYDAIISYVRAGGTAVAMGSFSSFVSPKDVKTFFSRAGLPWEAGGYHRTTHVLNPGMTTLTGDTTFLLPEYSQKAVLLNKVASTDALYITDESSTIESNVFAPSSAHAPGQTPVAMARVGLGRLGYVGDVNNEEGTHRVIFSMCGIPWSS